MKKGQNKEKLGDKKIRYFLINLTTLKCYILKTIEDRWFWFPFM